MDKNEKCNILSENSFFVIASGAKQSVCGLNKRLLRRPAPRNDNSRTVWRNTKLRFIGTIILSFIIIFIIFPTSALSTAESEISLSDYITYFYNKHSAFLDGTYQPRLRTWHFDIPYYEPGKRWQKTISIPRYHASSAMFYKYRLKDSPYARGIVREAILDATIRYKNNGSYESFDGAIASFLIVRLLEYEETLPKEKRLLQEKEKRKIFNILSERLFHGLPTKDTENRAALAGVYWRYTGSYLNKQGVLTDQEFIKVKEGAKQKIDQSIKETLTSSDNKYRESGLFSLHYHIVEAYMLVLYGHLSGEKQYVEKAKVMTEAINKLAKQNGFLDAYIGHRPSGIGAQGYLMAGALNLYFKNKTRAEVFFNYAYGARFFKDSRYQNRLVWYDTKAANPIFNDDISFANMAELAFVLFNKDEDLIRIAGN